MLHYLLKRLLLALPVLWLLATVVFLLSRLLPGSFASERILQESGGFYSKSSEESRQAAYREYLRKTGQDLPLFYFTVSASPEPDTLHLIYPETEQQLLKELSWRYGHWPAVATYYQHLKMFARVAPQAGDASYKEALETLLTQTAPEQIIASTTELVETASPGIAREAALALKIRAKQLLQHQQQARYLLPSIHWHGVENQYHQWLTSVLRGSLGTSFRSGRPVHEVLLEAISNTWWLLLTSIVLAFLVALELSILMVRRKGEKWRKAVLPWLFLLDSIPAFVLALLLLVLLASPSFLQLFPVYGMGYYTSNGGTWSQRLSQQVQYMALPTLCLLLVNIPYLTNQCYRAIAAAAGSDYARTARAKGLSEQQVIRRHVLRNALLPVITILSDALPALVAGTVVIETVFAIPGTGRLLVESVLARDYPIIVAIVLIVAVFKVLSHLLADLGYGLADPRIRYSRTAS